MKTAKILHISKKPDFQTNDGKTLFVFELELDNGDRGAIFKQRDNPYVEEGQSITYEMTERGTIKIQREGGFSSNNSASYSTKKDDVQDYIIKQSSLKCAIDLIVHDKIDPHDWKKTAENFFDWVKGNDDSQPAFENRDTKAPF